MESTTGDKQDVICFDHAVLRVDCGALHQRQQIALDPLARHVGSPAVGFGRNFIDFIEKHDAVLLDPGDRFGTHFFFIHALGGFFILNRLQRLGHFHFAQLFLAT